MTATGCASRYPRARPRGRGGGWARGARRVAGGAPPGRPDAGQIVPVVDIRRGNVAPRLEGPGQDLEGHAQPVREVRDDVEDQLPGPYEGQPPGSYAEVGRKLPDPQRAPALESGALPREETGARSPRDLFAPAGRRPAGAKR